MHYKTMFITVKKGTLLTVDTVTYAMLFNPNQSKHEIQTFKNRPQKGFFTVMP